MNREFTVDFSTRRAKLKGVFGWSGAPVHPMLEGWDFSAEYREARVSSLLVRAPIALVARSIFPDATRDTADPSAYDFTAADAYVLAAKEVSGGLLLSLGLGRADTAAPYSPELLADIYAGVIAHYNESFADGYKLGIKYCELHAATSLFDRAEEHAAAYAAVSSRLKARFPKLKLGGYSASGFGSLNNIDAPDAEREGLAYLEAFLSALGREEGAALDFFSWRALLDAPEELTLHANYAKNYLSQYGFRRTESIITSVSLADSPLSREYPSALASLLVLMQRGSVDAAYPICAAPYSSENQLFTLDDAREKHIYASLEVAKSLGGLIPKKHELASTQDYRRELYLLAVGDAECADMLLVTRNFSGTVDISLVGTDADKYRIKGILGGGKRGVGYSTEKSDIPITDGKILLKTGKNEVYFLTVSR